MKHEPAWSRALGVLTPAAWILLVGFFVVVGADLLWVVALGDTILAGGGVPRVVDGAAAPQVAGWYPTGALAQTLLALLDRLGAQALALTHLVLVAGAIGLLAREMERRGASGARLAALLSLVVVGTVPHLVVARLPSLSLLPYVALLVVLTRQHARPTAAVWFVPVLLAGWANLHGGVLVGVAVTGAYALFSRCRVAPKEGVALGVAAVASLFVTPMGPDSWRYYIGVLGNEAARRGTEMWARPDPTQPLDAALLIAALVLAVLAVRRRPAPWEWVAMLGLAVGTAQSARNGLWLVVLMGLLAAGGGRVPTRVPTRETVGETGSVATRPGRTAGTAAAASAPRRRAVPVATAVGLVAAAVIVVVRGGGTAARGADVVDGVRDVAAGRVVLAPEPLAETLLAGGVRVWAANPLDAFTRESQAAFLDYLDDGTVSPLMADAEVLVVPDDDPHAARAAGDGWVPVRRVGNVVVYERSAPAIR